ncbi:hypothetical protein P3T43_001785 [Paraburkholderia sp. GAS41]|uniref:lytic transglycosylase domain-containing protein n=1 Tax=Paraburkholderia sp. GAS41 TaxID=3035134 RepID=UPI003D1A9B1C
MADDLDKFVLQYTVELKDSIDRLNKLREKMDGVDKTHEKSSKNLKEFTQHFKGLTSEIGGSIGSLGKLASAAGPVGAAITAVGLAIKFASDQVGEYNANLKIAYGTGVSLTNLEGLRRSLTASGNVDRATVDNSLSSMANLVSAARIDPTGAEARKLAMMGGNVGSSVQDNLGLIGQRFQGMDKGQAEALGMTYGGLDPRMVDEMRSKGADAGKINMSDDQIANIQQYNQNLKDLNTTFNEGKSAIKEFSVGFAATMVEMGKATGKALSPSANGGWLAWMKKMGDSAMLADGGPVDPNNSVLKDTQAAIAGVAEQREKLVEDAKKDKEAQQTTFDASTEFARAAALFQSSVNAFTTTLDEKTVDATLAGESGAAGGMGGSASGRVAQGGGTTFTPGSGGSGDWKSSPYASLIEASAKKYNLDPALMWSVLMTESTGENGKTSPTGAKGLMQINHGNWKAYGNGRDIMDPAANIEVGARVLRESIDRAHGDITGGLNNYNGNSDPAYVAKVNGFYRGSMGTGQYHPVANANNSTMGKTASFAQTRLRDVAGAIAAGMHGQGITPEMLLRGTYNKGDVNIGYQRAMSDAKVEFMNAYQAANAGGMNIVQKQAAAQRLKTAALNERNLEANGAEVLARSREGGQTSLTQGQTIAIGSPNIAVNLNGFKGFDEKEFERRVEDVLGKTFQQVLNDMRTGDKI